MTYTIPVVPQTSPRPRLSRYGTYMPKKYTDYKKTIVGYLKTLSIPVEPYCEIVMVFYFPFPKSTPKKNMVEGKLHQITPDWDNLAKGFCDSLQDAGIIKNDSQICNAVVRKFYTTGVPRIEFSLK